jgi:hypothetical protein
MVETFYTRVKAHRSTGPKSCTTPPPPAAAVPSCCLIFGCWSLSASFLLKKFSKLSLRRGSQDAVFIRMNENAQSCPRILVFVRIWAFIHPESPGHSPGNARGLRTKRKRGNRLVAPTCRRQRPIFVLLASSSRDTARVCFGGSF